MMSISPGDIVAVVDCDLLENRINLAISMSSTRYMDAIEAAMLREKLHSKLHGARLLHREARWASGSGCNLPIFKQ